MFRKGYKQTKEHTKKIVEARKKNNSYVKNKNLFKKGHPQLNNGKGCFKKGQNPHNKGKLIPLNLDYLKKSYLEDKKSCIDLAKELNISDRTIASRLKSLGINLRKKTKHTERATNRIKERRSKQVLPVKDTSIEIKIQNFLKQLGIEFYTHQYMHEIKHSYQCDIMIPKQEGIYKKTIIECFGTYWHNYPTGRDIDTKRCNELRDAGWRVLVFWGNEINLMELDNLKEVITR